MDNATADAYLKKLQKVGFEKGIVVGKSFNTIAAFGDAALSAYPDAEGQTVNENQELLNDWFDEKRSQFKLFKLNFNIVKREKEERYLLGVVNDSFLVGFCGPDFWLAVAGSKKQTSDAGEAGASKELASGGAFRDGKEALNKAITAALEDLKGEVE